MKKLFTILVVTSFIIYISVLYFMLFAWFNRSPVLMSESMRDRLYYAYNLIPFYTIGKYLKALANGSGHAFRNLVGNLFLFVPLGFYLPYLVHKTAKIIVYSIVVTMLILIIEVSQLLTYTGSFDIDDYILNFTGALLGLLICKHTPIRKLFELRMY